MAPETTHTVSFVSACSKLIRIAIEGPKLESVNFEEILDIVRSLTDVFHFKGNSMSWEIPWFPPPPSKKNP